MNKLIVQRLLPLKQLITMSFTYLILWELNYFDFKVQGQDLPQTEVSSINSMVYQLKAKNVGTISKGYCQNTINTYGSSIKCNDECYSAKDCHISQVIFSGVGLTGTIDPGIVDLSQITVINLSNNNLHGPIPDSLGNLPKLRTLDLSNNQLSGTIPDNLGNNLRSLQYLYLHRNFLEGGIPASLGQLLELRIMKLDFNRLSGSLPSTLGNLQNLQYLVLSENKLSGEIPKELGSLTNLKAFWIPSNYFSGPLPDLEKLTQLQWFGVAGNELTGPLPPATNWARLEDLSLQGNNFDGPVHENYFQISSLESIIISDLTGTGINFPKKADLPNIYRLVLRRCSFTGSIPDFIGELSTLKHLDLSFNMLTGRIPESMRANLLYLSLARNNLNGTIPNWIFQATKTRMDLSYNNFSTTEIPIPSNLDLNLFACCCCAVSPTTEPYMLQPAAMDIEYSRDKPAFHNLFINSGGGQTNSNGTSFDADNTTSPFYTSPLQNWAYTFSGDFLVVTRNSSDFTKRVPCRISDSETSLYDDARLSPVSLQYYGFRLMRGLYNVTLHFAEIVYVDNADYDMLRKRIFDIYVQGGIVRKDFDISANAGGPNKATTVIVDNVDINETYHILDIHLYWAGKGSFVDMPAFNGPLIAAISVDPLFRVEEEKFAAWKIALITVSSLVVTLLLLLALAWSLGLLEDSDLKKKVKVAEMHQSSEREKEDVKVQLKKLVNATNNFSEGKKIGSGYLGAVYKAEVMESDPKITVAVKKFFPRHKGKIHSWVKREIYVLQSLEGGNLVKLLDAHIGDKLQLLIYEYMEKESLETALFESKVEPLPWKKRYEICRGIAAGLASLHEHRIKIVHGNLKSSNILLDKDDNPKLSDFGYAGIYDDQDKFSLIKQGASSGHLAPEYCQGGSETMKNDIYSFGVVLLEIVAGHRNKVSKGNQESTDLVNEVHLRFQSRPIFMSGLIDKRLEGDKDLNHKEVEQVLNLAVMCTSHPSLRPWIAGILSVLKGEKTVDEIRPVASPSRPTNNIEDPDKASVSAK